MIPRMKRRRKALFAAITLAFLFAVAEASVRLVGRTDAAGDFWIGPRRVPPRHFRLADVEREVAEVFSSPSSFVMYDPTLGWTIRPNARSLDGLAASNSLGLRSAPGEYAPAPPPGRVRIAIIGDSFTFGTEVSFEETWGHVLEARLRAAGLDVEVLNLGVAGYGFDQMLWRWRALGAGLRAHLVIFGFCGEDAERVVGLLRIHRARATWIPVSKPRFLLEGGALRVVGAPAVPFERLADYLRNYGASEVARYDRNYPPEDFEERPWNRSRLISTVIEFARRNRFNRVDPRAPESESGALSLALIDALRKEVEASGARFLTVHLPWHDDLAALAAGRPLAHAGLLARLVAAGTVVRPDADLLAAVGAAPPDALFKRVHYSALGNRVVADALARELLARRAEWLSPP
jgi:hypothetical protein